MRPMFESSIQVQSGGGGDCMDMDAEVRSCRSSVPTMRDKAKVILKAHKTRQ